MALLVLYWSIMIVFYLIASRLRRCAGRFAFVDRLMTLSVFALVFVMGLRMGANREITSSLQTIGVQAVLVTVLVIAFAMLGATLVRKLLHISKRAFPVSASPPPEEPHVSGERKLDASGTRTSLMIFLLVVTGMLLGYFLIPRIVSDLDAFEEASGDWIVIGLCIMLAFVGFSMGLSDHLKPVLQGAGPGVFLVPVFSVAGSLLGGAVYALLSPLSLREGLAIAAGFGWYTMAPGVISGAGYEIAGAISFLHNVLRETLGIILLPLFAEKFGCIEAVTVPGTAAMDVCLPIVERSCTPPTIAYSFTTGMVSCLACALLVPLIMGV